MNQTTRKFKKETIGNRIVHFFCIYTLGLGGRVVRTLDLQSTGCRFNSQPPHFGVQPWSSCSHIRASVTKQYNLVLAQAGKVTVGLASHWPCVTDNSGISTYRLTALEREMSTPPKLQPE